MPLKLLCAGTPVKLMPRAAGVAAPGRSDTRVAIPGLQVSKDREGCGDLPLQGFPGSPSEAAGDPGHQRRS